MMKNNNIKKSQLLTYSTLFGSILLAVCLSCSLLQAQSVDTTQQIILDRQNAQSQLDKPYVVMISIDGFRWDLADKYNAKFLKQMRDKGVQAQSMRPSYPSLTFPNHYAIVSGMYPSHNGLVDNYFYSPARKASYKVGDNRAVTDGSWYNGSPLWVLAEKAGMLSASYYWVGSEAAIDGIRPTYYYKYNEQIPIDRRVAAVKDWLELPAAKRPHLITFYFPEVDHNEHIHGVDAPEVATAVQFVDSSIHLLYDSCMATGLPINFIVVSDHGFANLDSTKYLSVPAGIDTSHYMLTGGSAMVHIYAKDKAGKKTLNKLYKSLKTNSDNYAVYKASKTPRSWHYRSKDAKDGRIGDITLVPNPPYSFYFGGRKQLGAHGFDNRLQDMQATFYAWGPAFKQHYKRASFQNVNVYPLVAHILGLSYHHKIDGKLQEVKDLLASPTH